MGVAMSHHILVTGGAGYIGSHTCKALAAAGYKPVVYDNLDQGHVWAVKWGPLVVGDLADATLLRQTLDRFRITAVVHFAAHAYVNESVSNPRKYFRNNVANTLTLLETMLNVGVGHLVFSSSCATFGIPRHLPIDEDHPQQPINPYGLSKLFVENALRSYGPAYGLHYVTLRYFNAAGADPEGEIGEDHRPETHLIPLAIAAAQGRIPHITIFGTDYDTPDGTAIRDYIHVADLATAHVKAIDHLRKGRTSHHINLGSGRGYSNREIIAAVEHVSGCSVPFVEGPRRPGDPPALIASVTRARAVLGWTPAFSSLTSILETAWRWHQRPRTTAPLRPEHVLHEQAHG
jgi:UDP-arabinose 4-epimerase